MFTVQVHQCISLVSMTQHFCFHLSRIVRKPAFCICEKKTQISFAVTAKLISAFVFAIRIVQCLYYLNPKFQASSHLLRLYSPVCVGPGRTPKTGFPTTRLILYNLFDNEYIRDVSKLHPSDPFETLVWSCLTTVAFNWNKIPQRKKKNIGVMSR